MDTRWGVIIAFLWATGAMGQESPVAATRALGEYLGNVRGGFGYIAGSETEAYSSFDFSCDADFRRAALSDACPGDSGEPAVISRELERSLIAHARADLVQRIREAAFEHTILQLAALENDRSTPPPVPACIPAGSPLRTLYSRLGTRQLRGDEIEAMPLEAQHEQLRYRAVAYTLSTGNLLRAEMNHRLLSREIEEFCNRTIFDPGRFQLVPNREYTDGNRSFCSSVENSRSRLEDNFPALFDPHFGTAEDQRRRIERLESAMGAVAGGEAWAAGRIYSGTSTMRDLERALSNSLATEGRAGPRFRALESAVRATQQEYRDFLRSRSRIDALCDIGLDEALTLYPNIARQALIDVGSEGRSWARLALCTTSTRALPLDSADYAGIRSLHDGTGAVRTVIVRRQHYDFPFFNSDNYRVELPPPARRQSVGPRIVVDVPIYLRGDADTPENIASLQSISTELTQFYECQSGARTHPLVFNGTTLTCAARPGMPNPPVRFSVRLRSVPQSEATVTLASCYNPEVSGDNHSCDNLRTFAESECRRRSATIRATARRVATAAELASSLSADGAMDLDFLMPTVSLPAPMVTPNAVAPTFMHPLSTEAGIVDRDIRNDTDEDIATHCRLAIAERARTPGAFNREDSAHWTLPLNRAVISHEVGHLMGLPDEYDDAAHTVNLMGPTTGLMRYNAPHLYPFDLNRMIEPVRCLGIPVHR